MVCWEYPETPLLFLSLRSSVSEAGMKNIYIYIYYTAQYCTHIHTHAHIRKGTCIQGIYYGNWPPADLKKAYDTKSEGDKWHGSSFKHGGQSRLNLGPGPVPSLCFTDTVVSLGFKGFCLSWNTLPPHSSADDQGLQRDVFTWWRGWLGETGPLAQRSPNLHLTCLQQHRHTDRSAEYSSDFSNSLMLCWLCRRFSFPWIVIHMSYCNFWFKFAFSKEKNV